MMLYFFYLLYFSYFLFLDLGYLIFFSFINIYFLIILKEDYYLFYLSQRFNKLMQLVLVISWNFIILFSNKLSFLRLSSIELFLFLISMLSIFYFLFLLLKSESKYSFLIFYCWFIKFISESSSNYIIFQLFTLFIQMPLLTWHQGLLCFQHCLISCL